MLSSSFILDAGPLGILSMIIATGGLALAVAQVAMQHRRSFEGAIAICAALALMVGLFATGVGLRVAADAITQADPAQQASMWRLATSIAWSATSVGALGAALDLGALACVGLLRPTEAPQ